MNVELKATYNQGTFQLDEPLKLNDGQQYTIVVKEIKDALGVETTNGNGHSKPETELATLQNLAENEGSVADFLMAITGKAESLESENSKASNGTDNDNWQPPAVLTGTGADLPPSVATTHREMYEFLSKPVTLKIAPQRKLDIGTEFEGDIVDFLHSIAGKWEGPEDWSEEHDHYLYGTPKRNQKNQVEK